MAAQGFEDSVNDALAAASKQAAREIDERLEQMRAAYVGWWRRHSTLLNRKTADLINGVFGATVSTVVALGPPEPDA